MFSIKSLVMCLCLLLVAGCGSSSKDKEKPDRERKITYDLLDFSDAKIPGWIDEPESGDKKANQKKFEYFIAESSQKNKRLCQRSSSARASAEIARQIAQFIKNSYAESVQGGEDEGVTEYMQEQLAQESQSFVIGARVVQKYWEKRKYREELGAEKNEILYTCFSLVKIGKSNLEKAIRNSRAKLLTSIDPEVKKKTEDALKYVEKKFEKPE